MIAAVPKVVVDHHPPGSAPIPGLSLRDPAACATGELVFDLLSRAGCRWDDATVTALYVAIVTDTGSFRHSNTSSRCHSIAAKLIDRGADPEGVHRRRTAQELYRKVRGAGVPFDLVVATPTDLDRHKDNPGLIYRTILEEGQEVYVAA